MYILVLDVRLTTRLICMLQLFDMKKFQANVSRELRRAYPDRRRLECQCLSAIAFVKTEGELLDCPIWVLIINVVAMDMLKSKLPPGTFQQKYKISTSPVEVTQQVTSTNTNSDTTREASQSNHKPTNPSEWLISLKFVIIYTR